MNIHEFTMDGSRIVVNLAQITMLTYNEPTPIFPNGVTIITLTDGKMYRFDGSNNDILYRDILEKMFPENVHTGSLSPWRDWLKDPPEKIEMRQIFVFYWDEGSADEQAQQGTPSYETLFFDGQQWADYWCKFDQYDRILYWMPIDPPTCAKEWRKKGDL